MAHEIHPTPWSFRQYPGVMVAGKLFNAAAWEVRDRLGNQVGFMAGFNPAEMQAVVNATGKWEETGGTHDPVRRSSRHLLTDKAVPSMPAGEEQEDGEEEEQGAAAYGEPLPAADPAPIAVAAAAPQPPDFG